MGFVFAYITAPSKKEAERIAEYLLKKRLIACANIFPISSIYQWKGKTAKQKEVVLIAKTSSKNFERVRREVERIHPYSIPCIIRIPVNPNKKYADWLKEEIREK